MVFGFFASRKGGRGEAQSASGTPLTSPDAQTTTFPISNAISPPESPNRPLSAFHRMDGHTGQAAEGFTGSLELRSLAELLSLIRAIPPKTLHSYLISHLPNVSSQESIVLSTFFATLELPPKLHCVRCHKAFVEVENDDRSCLVPHDDESTEVEYRGSKASNAAGSTYETIWGCCAKTVDGNGDQGPPDGWCYEGKHTTDAKRARFRADSTLQDDKLVSCHKLRCFSDRTEDIHRRKKLQGEEVSDEDGDHSEVERERRKTKTAKRKRNSSATRRGDNGGEGGDAEGSETASLTASTAGKSVSSGKQKQTKVQHMKRKSVSKLKPVSTVVTLPTPDLAILQPGHDPVSAPSPDPAPFQAPIIADHLGKEPASVTDGEGSPNATMKSTNIKKPRRSRQSGAAAADGGKYKPPKDGEESADDDMEEDEKPKKRRRKTNTAVA